MVFIDSHCHLEMLSDIDLVIARARNNDVKIIVYNSINRETMDYSLKLADKYKEIKVALGVYPIDAIKLSEKEFTFDIDYIKKNRKKIIAIGEVGIDLKESKDFLTQKKNLILFINLAKDLDLPLIIHSRGAEEKVIEILEQEKAKKVIMHCFCGNFKLVDKIVLNGWTLTIPTNVTFSEHFQKVVTRVPIENLLCETDSPFLHPIKGQRNNEPCNIIESYKMIAKIKRLNLKETEKIIESNFKNLFNYSI